MTEQDGVKIESRSGLGYVVVVTKAYKAGDVIVLEQPLLHVPHLKPSNPLYRPLQTYFEERGIPASVVLKLMAYFTASAEDQFKVLQCATPDPSAFPDAAVVKQAQQFADVLLEHPPVPEFAELMAAAAPAAAAAAGDPQQQQQQELTAHGLLVKLWLVWVTNGHSFRNGSALLYYCGKLRHTCAAPNTAYRTASGEVQAVHGMAADSGSSSTPGQLPPAAAAPPPAAAAAGYHVALANIQPGEVLTTNYLGLGHKRLMSTPARQKLLQSKFLFKCACDRCTRHPDLNRGIPCPICSGSVRDADKLLKEEVALPPWNFPEDHAAEAAAGIGGSAAATAALAAAGGLGAIAEGDEKESSDNEASPKPPRSPPSTEAVEGSRTEAAAAGGVEPSGSSSSGGDGAAECGYAYCDMAQLLSGSEKPWKCDKCDATYPDDSLALWGRFYTRSHASIERDMENWVLRLDDSVDATPFIRVPSSLHERVVGIVRLLGSRHWAAWLLLLLGVELHCGVLEQAAVQFKLSPTSAGLTAPATALESGQQQQQGSAELNRLALQNTAEDASSWVLSYCLQLWRHVQQVYGQVEAGQVLGYHFTEAAQVLLQVGSTPGLLPAASSESLMDAALNLQQLILPGMRSIMGDKYSPLTQLLGQQQQQLSRPLGRPAAATSSTAPAAAGDDSGAAGSASSSAAGGDSESGEAANRHGRYVAASVRKYLQQQQQAAEAARVQAVVNELRQTGMTDEEGQQE